jgi:hypothetical protein
MEPSTMNPVEPAGMPWYWHNDMDGNWVHTTNDFYKGDRNNYYLKPVLPRRKWLIEWGVTGSDNTTDPYNKFMKEALKEVQ